MCISAAVYVRWGLVWMCVVLVTVKSISIINACFTHWLHWVLPVAEGRCHQIQDNFHHAFWALSKMPSSRWVCGGGQVTACLPVCSWALLASSHASESCFFNIYAWFFLYIYFCFSLPLSQVHSWQSSLNSLWTVLVAAYLSCNVFCL